MGAARPHNPAARGELLGAIAPWRNRSQTKNNKPTLNTKLRILPPPPLPNRTGGFPASGSPVGGCSSRRLTDRLSALTQGDQAFGVEEVIGPFHYCHASPVHSGASAIVNNLFQRALQVLFRPHLVDEPEPFSFSHSCFQDLQHARRPHAGFHPRPSGSDLSALRRLGLYPGHWRRCLLPACLFHASTFLSSLARSPLRDFFATTRTLTPSGRGSSPRSRG